MNKSGFITITLLLFAAFCQAQIISKVKFDLPATDSIDYYSIAYLSDSLKVQAYIIEPTNVAGNKPVIIFNRGGNRSFSMVDSNILVQWIKPLAKAGYIVVASQYRGSAGSEGKDEFGGGDVNDVLNLIPLLNEIPNCDTSRIGMYGWSRGGIMTYRALTQTNRIKAAVVGGSPTDMKTLLQQRPELDSLMQELIPGYADNKDAELAKRSAISWAEKISINTALLIIHGKQDERVSYDQAQQISNRLIALGHIHRLVLFDADHIISQDRERKDKEIVEWFDKYLKKDSL